MPFTEEEKRRWHQEKKRREDREEPAIHSAHVAICLHCQQPFGISDGVITEEGALCDVCNGD